MTTPTHLKYELVGGLFDGLEEYFDLSVREVIVPCLPLKYLRDNPDFEGEWTEEDVWRPWTIPAFLEAVGEVPDYPISLYTARPAEPGKFFYAGPWR
jgi:hypothetical protein